MPMPKCDRLGQFGGELVVHVFDIGGDARRSAHRLPASGGRIDIEPEQSEHAVADELIGLSAGIEHRLRGRAEETIDQENDVERQPRFGELGRAAHVDEHADDVAFLADMDAAPVADEIGADIRRQHRE